MHVESLGHVVLKVRGEIVIYEGAQFVKRVPKAPLAFSRAQMTVRSRPMGAPMEALG